MTVSEATAPWEPLTTRVVDGPLDLLRLEATGTTAFGIRSGEVVLGVREIRTDGRLGPALPAATVGPGQLLILPPERKGRRYQLRCSEQAVVVALDDTSGNAPTTDLEFTVRGLFATPREARNWNASEERGDIWSAVFTQLQGRMDARTGELIAHEQRAFENRLDRLTAMDDAMLTEAARSMTRSGHGERHVTTHASTDRQLLAASLVLETIDVPIPENLSIDHEHGVDPIDQIARHLHVQHREVKLNEDWWRQEGGALLTVRESDSAPVALLPSGTGYRAVLIEENGAELTERHVDERFAAGLSPLATMFYRPLPARAIGARDLIRHLTRGNLRDTVMIVIATLITSVLTATVPLLSGWLIGSVIPGFNWSGLLFLGLMLVGIAMGRALTHVVSGIAFLRIETRASMSLTAAFVDRVLQLPASFFRTTSSGDLTQRVMAIEQIRALLTQSFLMIMFSFFAGLSNLGVLVYYDSGLAAAAFAVIAIELVIVLGLAVYVSRLDYRMSVAKGELDGFGIDMLSGIRQVRIQGSGQRVLAQIMVRLGRVAGLTYRAGIANITMKLVTLLFAQLAMLYVFVEFTAAMDESGAGPLGSGEFVGFITALAAFMATITMAAPGLQTLARIYPQYLRLKPILDAEPESAEHAGEAARLRGKVGVQDVVFHYGPDQPAILDGVTITAEPGEFIAIVGRTGCGKSTLLRVMLGLEKVESGMVRFDDTPLDSLDPTVVRSQVGVVMQSTDGLCGSVQSTILGAGSRRSMDDAWNAAAKAGIAKEIESMPMGMLTIVTPTSMSQSQIQRLMIARALVNGPEILFLDEATSALDNQTQSEITETIEQLGTTRVVIAHRLSTIRKADRIYVLEQGRVVQQGDFETLAAEDGHFRNLMAGQLS